MCVCVSMYIATTRRAEAVAEGGDKFDLFLCVSVCVCVWESC